MRFFWQSSEGSPSSARRTRLCLEQLESRLVPYSVTGNSWPAAQLVTLSFMPDGTLISSGSNGNVYSDLFSKMNSRWSTQTWEDAIISATQVWAQYANVNFTVVNDNGTPSGQGSYQQGDPGMGDIRFGAYSIGSGYLGMGYQPPPANNYSIAGDIAFNDQQSYNIGKTYDLQTVAMHEVGHALGLDHSATPGTVMWPYYNGTHTTLSSDDIAGIQAIYGARAPDAYNQGGSSNNSFGTAANITPLIDPSALTAQATSLDITSSRLAEYYTLTAPAGSGALVVSVQSSGLSLLRPVVTVYAADQSTVLGTASGAGQYNGATLQVSVSNVSPGQQFYIKVSGADNTAFGTGEYALTLGTSGGLLGTGLFGAGGLLGTGLLAQSLPSVPLPNTQLLDGAILQGGGGEALKKQAPDMLEAYPPEVVSWSLAHSSQFDVAPSWPQGAPTESGQQIIGLGGSAHLGGATMAAVEADSVFTSGEGFVLHDGAGGDVTTHVAADALFSDPAWQDALPVDLLKGAWDWFQGGREGPAAQQQQPETKGEKAVPHTVDNAQAAPDRAAPDRAAPAVVDAPATPQGAMTHDAADPFGGTAPAAAVAPSPGAAVGAPDHRSEGGPSDSAPDTHAPVVPSQRRDESRAPAHERGLALVGALALVGLAGPFVASPLKNNDDSSAEVGTRKSA